MSQSPGTEVLDLIDEVLKILQRDENRFYVEIDMTHHLRDQLAQSFELLDADE